MDKISKRHNERTEGINKLGLGLSKHSELTEDINKLGLGLRKHCELTEDYSLETPLE